MRNVPNHVYFINIIIACYWDNTIGVTSYPHLVAKVKKLFFPSATATPSRGKKGNGRARGWYVRRGSLLQDRLPVKFQDVKFRYPKFKHEIFMGIDMKNSYIFNFCC